MLWKKKSQNGNSKSKILKRQLATETTATTDLLVSERKQIRDIDPAGRVNRNPDVVYRSETKGGESDGLLLFNYGSRAIHYLEDFSKDIWIGCDGATISEIAKKTGITDTHVLTTFLMELKKRGLVQFTNTELEDSGWEKTSSEENGGMWRQRVYFDGPLFVQFDCTNKCNLNCRHCVTNSGQPVEGEITTSEALKLIERLGTLGVFQIGFSGGEPLMRPDIFELMNATREKGIKLQLTTNATLIDDEIALKLSEFELVTVGVSLEGGSKESYEYFRGEGNFEKFIEGVRTLKKHGLPIKFKSAILRKNLTEIDSIINLAIEEGVEAVDMFLFYPQGRGEHLAKETLNPHEIKTFLEKLSKKKQELQGIISIDVDDKPNAFLVDQTLSHSTCGAGVYWAEVLPNGNVVPCVFFKDTVAGNIIKSDFKEAWDSKVWEPFRDRRGIKGVCSKCRHLTRCGGGCRANGYMEKGDFLAEDTMCWYEE